jgi:hypothetical protein
MCTRPRPSCLNWRLSCAPILMRQPRPLPSSCIVQGSQGPCCRRQVSGSDAPAALSTAIP